MRDLKKIQKQVMDIVKIFDKVCSENQINYTLSAGSVLGAVRHKGFIPWDYDMDVLVPINEFEKMRTSLKGELKKHPEYKLYEWNKEKKYAGVMDRITPVNVRHEEIHLDIFPLIGAPSEPKEQVKFARKCFYSYKILKSKNANLKYSEKNHRIFIFLIKILLLPIPTRLIIKWYNHLQNQYEFEKAEYVHILGSGYGIDELNKKEVYMDTEYVDFEDIKLRIPKAADFYLKKVYGDDYMIPKKHGYKKIDKIIKNRKKED